MVNYGKLEEDAAATQPQKNQGPSIITAPTTYQRNPRRAFQLSLYHFGIVETVSAVIVGALCVGSLFTQGTLDLPPDKSYKFKPTYYAPGLWCGLFLLISGILGIRAKDSKSNYLHTANFIASLLAAFMMATLIGLSVLCSAWTYGYTRAVHNVSAILGFAAMVVCVIHFIYCCADLCCVSKSERAYSNFENVDSQQANGQYMSVPEPTGLPQTRLAI